MTTTWDKKEKEAIGEYGCELLVENASQDELKKTNYPNDAMIVTYKIKDTTFILICVEDQRLTSLIYIMISLVKDLFKE